MGFNLPCTLTKVKTIQLTWQDLKNLTDRMTEQQLKQPCEGLGTTITDLPYLLVGDEIED
jgi:hypothetical protein